MDGKNPKMRRASQFKKLKIHFSAVPLVFRNKACTHITFAAVYAVI